MVYPARMRSNRCATLNGAIRNSVVTRLEGPAKPILSGRCGLIRSLHRLQRFEDQVDPDRILPAAERERRATSARSAYFTRFALRSSRNRAKAAAARVAAVDFERAAEATDVELASALDAAAADGAA